MAEFPSCISCAISLNWWLARDAAEQDDAAWCQRSADHYQVDGSLPDQPGILYHCMAGPAALTAVALDGIGRCPSSRICFIGGTPMGFRALV
jgi:hypothetical protein